MKRTSRAITARLRRLRTITAHISPYVAGLAPETRDFVALLNAEAARLGTGVKYVALANKIEATGDIGHAASLATTMGGWFLSRGIGHGYLEGEEPVLQRGNSQWRKHLRRRDKTKAGMAEADMVADGASRGAGFIRTVTVANGRLHELVKAVPKAELSRLGIDPTDFRRARLQLPLQTNFPQKEKLPTRRGSKPPNSTTFRKGGPNPRRRSRPDS
jgi:hypothetical protein